MTGGLQISIRKHELGKMARSSLHSLLARGPFELSKPAVCLAIVWHQFRNNPAWFKTMDPWLAIIQRTMPVIPAGMTGQI